MIQTRRNAVIMAAGTSSRFVPLSAECPKGLLSVKGEILIERQIRQLREAGIDDITIVVGYKAGMFDYLSAKYGVCIVMNEDYARYNNTSSLIRVLDRLGDTFICSSDNYFPANVFACNPDDSFYSAMYASGVTAEYCLSTDSSDNIVGVSVGGADSWYMVGHVYFSAEFSRAFAPLLLREYDEERTRMGYWEDVYMRHIDSLPPMKVRRYSAGEIEEFDSLDELRRFDTSYISDTRSTILKEIASRLRCPESALSGFVKAVSRKGFLTFDFLKDGERYRYYGCDRSIILQ